MKETYEVKFNDFGVCYVIAHDFSDAESKFLISGYAGESGTIKSIVKVSETNEPLF